MTFAAALQFNNAQKNTTPELQVLCTYSNLGALLMKIFPTQCSDKRLLTLLTAAHAIAPLRPKRPDDAVFLDWCSKRLHVLWTLVKFLRTYPRRIVYRLKFLSPKQLGELAALTRAISHVHVKEPVHAKDVDALTKSERQRSTSPSPMHSEGPNAPGPIVQGALGPGAGPIPIGSAGEPATDTTSAPAILASLLPQGHAAHDPMAEVTERIGEAQACVVLDGSTPPGMAVQQVGGVGIPDMFLTQPPAVATEMDPPEAPGGQGLFPSAPDALPHSTNLAWGKRGICFFADDEQHPLFACPLPATKPQKRPATEPDAGPTIGTPTHALQSCDIRPVGRGALKRAKAAHAPSTNAAAYVVKETHAALKSYICMPDKDKKLRHVITIHKHEAKDCQAIVKGIANKLETGALLQEQVKGKKSELLQKWKDTGNFD